MTVESFLSRARVRRDAPIASLRQLLVPNEDEARISAAHQLVWTLFSDDAERDRDFLWRESEPGCFYILSRRRPEDRHGIFQLDPPKVFAPQLRSGDRLGFALRANATVSKAVTKGARGKPCDVVMDALYRLPRERHALERPRLIDEKGRDWLQRQGERAGFSVTGAQLEVRVMGYRSLKLRRRGAEAASVGVLDFEGTLRVDSPDLLVDGISRGFGRAKAFGCGLMLIRRA